MATQITVNHITFRAKSTLNILSDICAICRENVCDKCIKCSQDYADHKIENQCYSVIGVCNHAFHYCCIQKYVASLSSVSRKCPLCNQKWELKKRSFINKELKTPPKKITDNNLTLQPTVNPGAVINYYVSDDNGIIITNILDNVTNNTNNQQNNQSHNGSADVIVVINDHNNINEDDDDDDDVSNDDDDSDVSDDSDDAEVNGNNGDNNNNNNNATE